ncbi:MAG: preprotein translocase subunit YajC [Chloroflexi bacterium]|nr:preprotein translocase subunit YajC [Chloroflexota bacterium]
MVAAGIFSAGALIAGCAPAAAPSGGASETGSVLPLVIFMVLIFGFMYFGVIRPQRKRQKAHTQMVQALKKGDKVITAGGIFGVIESIAEDSIVIKVEGGQTLRVAKGSVAVRQER